MEYDDLLISARKNMSDLFQMSVQGPRLVSDGGAVAIRIGAERIQELRASYQALIERVHTNISKSAASAAPSNPDQIRLAAALQSLPPAKTAADLEKLYAACVDFFTAWDAQMPNLEFAADDRKELWDISKSMLEMLPQESRLILAVALRRARASIPPRGLRIILRVEQNARELLDLPWELMSVPYDLDSSALDDPYVVNSDQSTFRFLCLYSNVILLREIPSLHPYMPITIDPALSLQLVAAPLRRSPINTNAFLNELGPIFQHRPREEWWSDHPDTLESLQDRLHTHQPQIVQLLCHGKASQVTAQSRRHDILMTYHVNGQPIVYRVSAQDLWPVLGASSRLQLVVLTICDSSGAQSAQDNAEVVSNIAYELVQSGVPIVIGMQGAISQRAAARFSGELYRNLREGRPLEWAITAARIAVSSSRWLIDWSIPVVYRGVDLREPAAWHVRMADFLEDRLLTRRYRRGRRAGAIAIGIVFICGGLMRWLLQSDQPVADSAAIRLNWGIWGVCGVIWTIVIDYFMRTWRRRITSPEEARVVRYAHGAGALLGYVIGGAICFSLLIGGYLIASPLLPATGWQPAILAAIVWSCVYAYMTARSQARGARNNWRLYTNSYLRFAPWSIVYIAMLVLLLLPPLGLDSAIGEMFIAIFSQSGLSAIVIGFLIFVMIASLDRS